MMQTHVRRSTVLVLVLVALAAIGLVRLSAQAPAQGPASAPAAAPGLPPAPPDVAAPPADAEKSASGLAWKILQPGTGKVHPGPNDNVTLSYTGWTTSGRPFAKTGPKPAPLQAGKLLPGMAEGVQLMTVGEKRRFWIPEDLAYKSAPGKPQGMCVFEIELLDVQAGAPATVGTATPPDVAAPPADAEKTKSGLASKVLKPGTGKKHPNANSTVTVHYSGWTTDGKMFDSSVLRGQPISFPLNGVIAGWTEGVQLMVEGEQRRFWIPGKLAYDNSTRADAPKGMLVFDVELIKIQ